MRALRAAGEFRLAARGFVRFRRAFSPAPITMNNNAKNNTKNNAVAGQGARTFGMLAAWRALWPDEPALRKRANARGARGIADLSLATDAFPPRRGGDIIRILSLAGRVSRRRPQWAAAHDDQGRAPWHEKIRVRR